MTDEQIIAYLDGLPQDEVVLHGAREPYSLLKPALPTQPHLIEEYNLSAVYGTLFTEIAILYAVIHEKRSNWGWKIYPERTPSLYVDGPTFLSGGTGYIHILKRTDFTRVIEPGLVCLAFNPVESIEVVEVRPHTLELLQKQERMRCLV